MKNDLFQRGKILARIHNFMFEIRQFSKVFSVLFENLLFFIGAHIFSIFDKNKYSAGYFMQEHEFNGWEKLLIIVEFLASHYHL